MSDADVAELNGTVDGLHLTVDGGEIRQALWALDRLAAKISAAVGDFDAAELYDAEGAHSMASWLSYHAGLAGPDGRRLASTARRLRALPVARGAWVDGALSGGQVRVICANLTDATAPLFTAEGVALPGATGPRAPARATTSCTGPTAAPPHSTTSPSTAARPPALPPPGLGGQAPPWPHDRAHRTRRHGPHLPPSTPGVTVRCRRRRRRSRRRRRGRPR